MTRHSSRSKSRWRALLAALTFGLVSAHGTAIAQEPAPMPSISDLEQVWVLELSNGGSVRILLRPDKAPAHVERIKFLTRQGFYDGLTFHRVVDGFVAQGGDPLGNGQGGSDLPDLTAEFNELIHLRGSVAMARSDSPDSANSQFYICFNVLPMLDNKYTVFGRVFAGMEAVDQIARGEPPSEPTRIQAAYIAADRGAAAPNPADAPAIAEAMPAVESPAPVDDASAAPETQDANGGADDAPMR